MSVYEYVFLHMEVVYIVYDYIAVHYVSQQIYLICDGVMSSSSPIFTSTNHNRIHPKALLKAAGAGCGLKRAYNYHNEQASMCMTYVIHSKCLIIL